jgi:hypothetical protein
MIRAPAIYTFAISAFLISAFLISAFLISEFLISAFLISAFLISEFAIDKSVSSGNFASASTRRSRRQDLGDQSDMNGNNTHSNAANKKPRTETTVDITVQV